MKKLALLSILISGSAQATLIDIKPEDFVINSLVTNPYVMISNTNPQGKIPLEVRSKGDNFGSFWYGDGASTGFQLIFNQHVWDVVISADVPDYSDNPWSSVCCQIVETFDTEGTKLYKEFVQATGVKTLINIPNDPHLHTVILGDGDSIESHWITGISFQVPEPGWLFALGLLPLIRRWV